MPDFGNQHMDPQETRGYTSARMETSDFKRRTLLWGHLVVTLPAIAAILLVAFLYRNYLLFPAWLYYVVAGAAVGYQWYAAALPRWKEALRRKDIPEAQIEDIVRQGGLALPGVSAAGLFALHTTGATLCATYLNVWLAGLWVHWALPLTGATVLPNSMDFYLQHFGVGNFIPALLVGYFVSRKFPEFGSWAWLLPSIVMAYMLLTFPKSNVSVFASSNPWHNFSYYFVIEQSWPRSYQLFSSYAERAMLQVTVVSSFYSSLAYSIGVFAGKRRILDRAIGNLRRNRGVEYSPVGTITEHAEEESDVNC